MFKHDTHLHFDLYKDRQDVLKYVEKNTSYTIAVTNLPGLYERYLDKYDDMKYVRIALGFHPELVQQYKNQIAIFEKYVKNARYIGEIGLDFSARNKDNQIIQVEVFKHIIQECNKYRNKILTVHSRNAEAKVIEILEELHECKVIMHWYSGSIRNMNKALDRGYFFSVNPQMLLSKNGRKIVDHIPLDRMLIESDAPFTQGLTDEYSIKFQEDIYQYLMNERNMTIEDVSALFRSNFKRLLT